MQWIGLVWLTVLGACVGSFLNVVVYRLPRGENLSHPGSRCPSCGHAIRWFHNIPILSWIVLRGRCYDCQAPIAARYPIVEGTTALVFLVLAATGPLSTHVLDLQASAEDVAAAAGPFWLAYAWDVVLLSALFAVALIDRDLSVTGVGRFPLKLIATLFLLAVLLPILVPGMLVYTQGGSAGTYQPPSVRLAVQHVAFGALTGCGCGSLMFAASRGGKGALRHSALPALVGPYVGPWLLMQIVGLSLWMYVLPALATRGTAQGPRRWWSWPLVFWLTGWAAIVVARVPSPVQAAVTSPPLSLRVAIAACLSAALLAYAWTARTSRPGVE